MRTGCVVSASFRAGTSGQQPPAAKPPRTVAPGPRLILDALRRTPGLSAGEIAALLGLPVGPSNRQLRVLVRDGLVERVRRGRHALHFLTQTSPPQRLAFAVLRLRGVGACARDAFAHPRDPPMARARRLGVPERQVRRALRALERDGLARIERNGQGTPPTVRLHQDVRMILGRWSEVRLDGRAAPA